MKDEIKKILRYLRIENGRCSSELSYEETHILLDYITNLQEEIHKKEAMYDSLAVVYRLLQEENERLRIIEEKYKDSKLYIKDFKEEIERLNKQYDLMEQSLDDKQNVIDKATEIIEPFIEWGECTINGKILKEIYDKLKGE